jgi:rRNA maturation RNase YbeY
MTRISFFEQTPVSWFKGRRQMKVFLESLFHIEDKTLQHLTVIFCTDDQLLEINQQFLNHDNYTDIITFDLTDADTLDDRGRKLPITGEVYISIDRVKDNAIQFSTSKENELYRVLFHGCLHLCGYGDKKPAEKRRMTEKENFYLSLYGQSVPRGTIQKGRRGFL